ncbi:MAG TPA: class I SAM-dependent methyltransferase [Cellulomonadaceae bacterium]|nr:class I SAM-dependent methyltransferase [Cellulomonadaceae bacterium]
MDTSKRLTCRSCGSVRLTPVINLGNQRLSDFRDDDITPPAFPLAVAACDDCTLAQLTVTTPRDLLYHDRYGFKSGVNATVRADLRDIVRQALAHKPDPDSWLDIACNDGTLLSNVPKRVYRAGVDAVDFLATEAEQHADRVVHGYFTASDFATTFDVITSISMFYDLDDPNRFVAEVAELLRRDGVWVIQQNYWTATLRLGAVDNICHEHVTYFSLRSLEALLDRHGLEVFHVEASTMNGGSLRTLVCHQGRYPRSVSVPEEDVADLTASFGARAWANLGALEDLISRLVDEDDATVYVYGASTRGQTILQAAGIDSVLVRYAVDRNPAKVGKRIASTGMEIISEEQARAERPDYMLVLPWFFRAEFIEREADYLRAGGRLIFPLPEVEIVGAEALA